MKKIILALLIALFPSVAMSSTTTTHYGFTQPSIGDTTTWGISLNSDLAAIDSNLWNASGGLLTGVNTQSSTATIILTNQLDSVQNITLTSSGQSLEMPAMNATTSAIVGSIITIINSGSYAFSIIAQDGSTSILSAVYPGQTVYLVVTSNSTANGSFTAIAQSSQPNVNVTSSVPPANGLYLPASNTVGVSADSLPVAEFFGIASAVNYIALENAITGSEPIVAATGSDTNVGLQLTSKGTGAIDLYTANSTVRQMSVLSTASAVNYVTATGATTGNPPKLSAAGSDTNVSLQLSAQGTGSVAVSGPLTVSGSASLNGGGTSTTPSTNDSSTNIATTAFANPGNNLNSPGWRKNPDGTIEEWGTGSFSGSQSVAISFPKTFSSAVFSAEVTPIDGGTSVNYRVSVSNVTVSGMTIDITTSTTLVQYYWHVIGH